MQRTQIWIMMLVLAVLAFARAQTAQADINLTSDQMKAALRTATVEEDGFIDRVLVLVQRGILPEDLVQSTFLWARKKAKHKFQYFKIALKLRAADRGTPIPF
jgi:sulfite exporter TauE/SafE